MLTFARYDKIGEGALHPSGFSNLLCSTQKLRCATQSILSFLIQKLQFRLANCGAILIEFAICMPILIILLFYINDLVRIKRMYSQTEFVAQQMANIIQNISQKREGEEKKIKFRDVQHAASLSYLTIYPGKTLYADGKRGNYSHELSHIPYFFIYYVKGLPEGKASVIWSYLFYCYGAINPTGWVHGKGNVNNNYGVVKHKTNVTPKDIYPTLKINEGEVRIIIECPLFCRAESMSLNAYAASDNQDTRAKKAFNCRLVTPKASYKYNDEFAFYFPSIVIFTPKQDLFDDNGLRN